jgi:hypothetical protein
MYGKSILMMTAAVMRLREILMAVALLLLNKDMEGLQLLLHVLDRVADELSNSHNVMLATPHCVLLTCNHGLQLEIVI